MIDFKKLEKDLVKFKKEMTDKVISLTDGVGEKIDILTKPEESKNININNTNCSIDRLRDNSVIIKFPTEQAQKTYYSEIPTITENELKSNRTSYYEKGLEEFKNRSLWNRIFI